MRWSAPKRWTALAGLAAVCLAAQGQSAPRGARPYTIAGTVVNSVTGEPVGNAQVAVLAESDSHLLATANSDGDGHFALKDLPAAKYQLSTAKRGFHTAFFNEHGMFNSAVVTGPGLDTEHLVFRLPPNASLRGAVTDDGGDPVDGARVMLFELPADQAGSLNLPGASGTGITQSENATSDDTGAYEFNDLAAGKYVLAVVAEPWYAVHTASHGSSSLDIAYPITFFDSTTDEASAAPIALTAGAREEANIVLHAVPALRLAVAGARNPRDKNPAAPVTLQQSVFGMAIPVDAPPFSAAQNPNLSEFAGLAPGHYQLTQGNPPRIAEIDAASNQQIEATEGTPTVPVSGTLLGTSGQPLTNSAMLGLFPVDAGRRTRPLLLSIEDGHFRFDAVLPGKWELRMWDGMEAAVVSIRQNGKMHAGNSLTVGEAPLTVSATVNLGKIQLRGFARKDGKGFPGAMVVLAPKDPLGFPMLIRRDQSDSDGSFSLNNVAPGTYTAVAIEDGWNLDWTDSKTLARFLPRGVTVNVAGDAGGTVRLSDPVAVQSR